MQPLEKTLRNQLEITVKEARDVAEIAARVALEQLGVGEALPFAHLSERERKLRRKLRAHGRQLGDTLNGGKDQTLDRLIEEVAYEHWHRMLFARFLEENDLLMYPDPANPVPVSLEECEDLAAKEGAKNGWELAARFAAQMLPQIFRPDSPVFKLVLPPEYQQKLERLVDELPKEVFSASDSLGWVYQFWQSKKKEEVNASEVKIGARELPAVTQLFTEPYMVSFLLDNSLGAWWASRRLTKKDFATAKTEKELRQKASLPGLPLKYLRFVKSDDGLWTPASGTFDGWPEHLSELKVLDPCCGSGHFLVAAFLMLVPMRMELEGLSVKYAVDAVLRDNLHGLEIDRRCVELAAFALALAAWRYPNAGGYKLLPELHLACSGLAVSAKREDWLALAGGDANLWHALKTLYEQFKDAPVLGSLINPELSLGKGTLVEIEWEKVAPLLNKALSGENDYEKTEMRVVAQGIAKAADLLRSKYHWVSTNVPYLGQKKQSVTLRHFCEKHYFAGKSDLATVFLDRCLQLCFETGTSSIVLPQNWLFLTSYKDFREKLLENNTWHLFARLGPSAFETISGEIVKAMLLIISRGTATKDQKLLSSNGKSHAMYGLDVSELQKATKKAVQLSVAELKQVEQASQLKNPDARVTLEEGETGQILSKYAISMRGIVSGDNYRWERYFWEIPYSCLNWRFLQTTPIESRYCAGKERIINWATKGKGMLRPGTTNKAYGKKGIAIGQMSGLPASLFDGSLYDNNTGVLVPHNPADLPAMWCFCSSSEYTLAVRRIDQKLNVTNATLVKVPFDLDHWTKIAQKKYPYGLPKPYSNDPTQWIFHGHPAQSDKPLQVAVARLLGYRWPAELDSSMELSDEARYWIKKSEGLCSCADEDGIVCIPPVRGEMKAEDRLENLLAAVYGSDWTSSKKSELLAQVGYAGKTLESWLREKFFTQHCKLFKNRPFVWHIWDGLHDGFVVLVNYHKLDAKLLEKLIYTYLGDWIKRQKQDKRLGVDGAEEKLAAAEALKKRLELILEGEKPYDIFVRWKPIENQPIGWNPDLNDGVRLNIRPFMSVPNVGKKGTGVLRDRPNIKWNKDRGKDVESAPWHTLFKGERINDYHLSLEKKLKAREKKNEQISR